MAVSGFLPKDPLGCSLVSIFERPAASKAIFWRFVKAAGVFSRCLGALLDTGAWRCSKTQLLTLNELLWLRELYVTENMLTKDEETNQSRSLQLLSQHGFGDNILRKLKSNQIVSSLPSPHSDLMLTCLSVARLAWILTRRTWSSAEECK